VQWSPRLPPAHGRDEPVTLQRGSWARPTFPRPCELENWDLNLHFKRNKNGNQKGGADRTAIPEPRQEKGIFWKPVK